VRESASISSFHLATPDGAPLPAALPGQFLTFRLPALDGPALIRSYSMSGPPGAGGYRISVKREPSGAGSRYMHDRVHAGDTLEVAAPRGSFVLRAANTPVLLVSAGVGATPVLAMLHALAAQRATREVWWLHGARDRDEHAFAAEARDILARLPNARVHVCFSRPAASDTRGVDYTSAGRITPELLAGLGLPRDADAYVCGPAAFMQDVTAGLVAAGVTPSAVHTEIFGAAPSLTPGVRKSDVTRTPHPPAAGDGAGPEVSFARSGLTVRWSSDSTTLLELAEACDVPTRWSCRTGVCHNCETALVSGTVTHEPDPVEPPAAGNVLLCCARPRGDVVLDL
jgi:ferredoxin-NADP reductase